MDRLGLLEDGINDFVKRTIVSEIDVMSLCVCLLFLTILILICRVHTAIDCLNLSIFFYFLFLCTLAAKDVRQTIINNLL